MVTTKEMLLHAQEKHYAVGAFNVENMEMIQAVLGAAERLRAPVIMQTTPSALKYAGADYFYGNVFRPPGIPVSLLRFIWITAQITALQFRQFGQGILRL